MLSVLMTAFEPYDRWSTNASWLAMVEFTKNMPAGLRVTTRRYPVDFTAARSQLEKDLAANHDFAIHLGQAPGSASLRLESIGINVRGTTGESADRYPVLVPDGPAAYRSSLPLSEWAVRLRESGIPAHVSFHAGTYLCNATLYWSHHIIARHQLKTQTAFIHLPLDISQTLAEQHELPALSSTIVAAGLHLIIQSLPELGRGESRIAAV